MFDEWAGLKKMAKDVKKEISPLISNENEKTTNQIKKLEEDLKQFNGDIKKRDFYLYKTGVEDGKKKLELIYEEIKVFEDKMEDYGYNA